MSANAESEAQGVRCQGLLEVMSLELPEQCVGTLVRARSHHGGREFQILGDATGKLRAPDALRANGTVSRLASEDLN